MSHDHGHSANRNRLLIAIGIVGCVLVVQAVGAWISGSLALAGRCRPHAQRPHRSDHRAHGDHRRSAPGKRSADVRLPAGGGLRRTDQRADPRRRRRRRDDRRDHPPGRRRATPTCRARRCSWWRRSALVANVAALLVLRPAAGHSINMRGAYLEVFGDLVGSILVIAAALVIMFTGFVPADAIASLVIAALILPRAFVLLRDVVRVLSESAPADTDVAQIREHILGTAGVVDVHDVHVWAITSGAPVFTAHVVVEPQVFRSGETGAAARRPVRVPVEPFRRRAFDVPAGTGRARGPRGRTAPLTSEARIPAGLRVRTASSRTRRVERDLGVGRERGVGGLRERGLLGLPGRLDVVPQRRNERHDDGAEQDDVDVLLHEVGDRRDVADDETEVGESGAPEHARRSRCRSSTSCSSCGRRRPRPARRCARSGRSGRG